MFLCNSCMLCSQLILSLFLITVHYVLRKSCKRWSLKMVTFTAPDAKVAHGWVLCIQEKIQQTGTENLSL